MDLATFRATFTEFDAVRYPDATVQFYLDLANESLNPQVWGARLDKAVVLYTAHFVKVQGPSPSATAAPNSPNPPRSSPDVPGLVTSKSVGGVSKSYDVSVGQTDGGGSFNLTQYGRTYLTLRSSISVGFQL